MQPPSISQNDVSGSDEEPPVKLQAGIEVEIEMGGKAQLPFLLRFPSVMFGVPLGILSQATLYKTLSSWRDNEKYTDFLIGLNWGFWCMGIVVMLMIFSVYLAKLFFYPWAVVVEWRHNVRSNFFFAPIIACVLVGLGIPDELRNDTMMEVIFWGSIAWYLLLALPLYQTWFMKGTRTIHHGNPTYQIAVVANFLIAFHGFQLGYNDVPLAFFAIGTVFQSVVFTGLFTSTPRHGMPSSIDTSSLKKEAKMTCLGWFITHQRHIWTIESNYLNPTMFLFIAPPSFASITASAFNGTFDNTFSLGAFFVGLFLYAMQLVNLNIFISLPFSPTWWAYTFPMTASATASIKYAQVRGGVAPNVLCVFLTCMSTFWVLTVFVKTVLAISRGKLFGNDPLITIYEKIVSPSPSVSPKSDYGTEQSPEGQIEEMTPTENC